MGHSGTDEHIVYISLDAVPFTDVIGNMLTNNTNSIEVYGPCKMGRLRHARISLQHRYILTKDLHVRWLTDSSELDRSVFTWYVHIKSNVCLHYDPMSHEAPRKAHCHATFHHRLS